jgi:uncharacterized LabA/DUF88 family protein
VKVEFRVHKSPSETDNDIMTAVFIDYESLYFSFLNKFACAPDLFPMIDDVKKHGKVLKVKVFGDFTKPELNQERNRIRTVTSDITDCSNESTVNKKDFTDFIMLDQMYQEIIQNPVVKQFVLFTGDGHFSSIATFMKTFMDKIVGVYGVPGTLSHQLRECSSWTKLMNVIDEEDAVYQANLLRNFRIIESRGMMPTFMKTVENVQRIYGGSANKYELILREMISDGYVRRELRALSPERQFQMLIPDWEKIEAELFPALPADLRLGLEQLKMGV